MVAGKIEPTSQRLHKLGAGLTDFVQALINLSFEPSLIWTSHLWKVAELNSIQPCKLKVFKLGSFDQSFIKKKKMYSKLDLLFYWIRSVLAITKLCFCCTWTSCDIHCPKHSWQFFLFLFLAFPSLSSSLFFFFFLFLGSLILINQFQLRYKIRYIHSNEILSPDEKMWLNNDYNSYNR